MLDITSTGIDAYAFKGETSREGRLTLAADIFCVSDVRSTIEPSPVIYGVTLARWGNVDLRVDANGGFVSNNNIFTILFCNTYYQN